MPPSNTNFFNSAWTCEMNILKLHEALSSVASISGVSIGDPEDRTTWRIDFDQNSTEEQKLDAKTLLYAYVEPSSTKTKLYKSTFIRRIYRKAEKHCSNKPRSDKCANRISINPVWNSDLIYNYDPNSLAS